MKEIKIEIPDFEDLQRQLEEIKKLVNVGEKGFKKTYLPRTEMAKFLSVDIQTLDRYADVEYKKYYFGNRLVFFKIEEIHEFLERSTQTNP